MTGCRSLRVRISCAGEILVLRNVIMSLQVVEEYET
jgi:hypothetical protein